LVSRREKGAVIHDHEVVAKRALKMALEGKVIAMDGKEIELKADDGTKYSEVVDVNLGDIEPLIALPHSPDNVKTVSEVEGTPVDQVCIGSCTNSSLRDLKTVAALLKGKKLVIASVSPFARFKTGFGESGCKRRTRL
jgi:homoaconitase/3-isopropylmalate dehydratase large subunit